MSWVRNVILSSEDALQRALAATAARASSRRAAQPVESSYFRGRGCHCDATAPIHLVHSEGLREACDFVIDLGANVTHPERPPWPVEKLAPHVAELAAGASIHLKTDHLEAFEQHLLPALRAPVVVVSGDSDASFGAEHAHLLEHPRIGHWFAQNVSSETRHPRLTRIPIGFDNPVYTKLEKRLGFALTVALGRTPFDASLTRNDIGDQRLLQQIASALPPTHARAPRALCTFHMNQKLVAPDLSTLPDRREAYRVLHANPACHFVERRLPQAACWQLHGEFAFQISPLGNGLDCFRTWESLFLGVLPIVRRSPLDALYEDEQFPVVIVDSWDEVTEDRLRRWHVELADKITPEVRHKLTNEHWVARLRQAQQALRAASTAC